MLVNMDQRIVKTALEVKIHFIHTSGLVNRIPGGNKRFFFKPGPKLKVQVEVKVHWDLT